MNRDTRPSSPPSEPAKPCCGNCCNAVRSTRTVGVVICTALPPHVLTDPRHAGMAKNVYPELPAEQLGCNVLWNVNANLFHILGQAVTLASQPASNDHGESSPEKDSAGAGGTHTGPGAAAG